MAELSRFFADNAGDRLNTAAQMNRLFDQLLQEKDGVIRGLGNTLAVTNAGTVSADVNTGSAVMGGRLYENTASKNLVLDAVTSGSKRYDRIVVRVDETARTMVLTVIKGVEGASPAEPAIDGTTDVLLAKILLDRSSGSYVYTVTDERVYCDGLLLPAIIAILNATPPTAAGITDANAIAAATGATLAARLIGLVGPTIADGQPPMPRPTGSATPGKFYEVHVTAGNIVYAGNSSSATGTWTYAFKIDNASGQQIDQYVASGDSGGNAIVTVSTGCVAWGWMWRKA